MTRWTGDVNHCPIIGFDHWMGAKNNRKCLWTRFHPRWLEHRFHCVLVVDNQVPRDNEPLLSLMFSPRWSVDGQVVAW